MKFLLTIISLLAANSLAFSDVRESWPVGPGVVHYHEFLEAGPWHVHVLEVDLTQQWIHIETVKANDQLYGNETTSSMAARSDREGHRVVGAVNADFYGSGGIPVGAQVINGMLLKKPTNRSVFGYTKQKRPLIDIVSFQGKVFTSRGSTWAIDGVNEARSDDKLIVYNRYYGLRTQTNYWGTEIVTEMITATPAVNDTILAVVFAKDSLTLSGHGSSPIPFNGLVFSGHGKSADFLNHDIFVGDTLKILLQLPPIHPSLLEVAGGTPRLVRNGKASVEWINEHTIQSFAYERHPRTALGVSRDSTKLYLFTVDGRQAGYSVGMSLFELGDYMLEWDVYQGINFDGGGSTTMVVRGEIVNSPSDANGERAVANALMVISEAPTRAVAMIRLDPKEVYLTFVESFQFSASGLDKYYNIVDVHSDSLVWSCHPQIGNIDASGLFTAGNELISGYVFAQYGTVRDSSLVHITETALIRLSPNPVVVKVGQKQKLFADTQDSSGHNIELGNSDFQWTVSGGVGKVTSEGEFFATQMGEGFVIAANGDVAGSTHVSVDFAAEIVIDDFSSTDNWKLGGVNVNLSQCQFTIDPSLRLSIPSSGRLDYNLTTGGSSVLYLDCAMPILGTPAAANLHVYGDGQGQWLRGEFQDADGEIFLVDFTEPKSGIDWSHSWRNLSVPLDNAIPHRRNPAAVPDFPIKWTKIYLIETKDSKGNAGTIYLDDLMASYIQTDMDQDHNFKVPCQYRFQIDFPNLSRPVAQISFSLPQASHVNVKAFNVLGEHIVTVLNRHLNAGIHHIDLDISRFENGVYLWRIQAGEFQQTQKIVVMNVRQD